MDVEVLNYMCINDNNNDNDKRKSDNSAALLVSTLAHLSHV